MDQVRRTRAATTALGAPTPRRIIRAVLAEGIAPQAAVAVIAAEAAVAVVAITVEAVAVDTVEAADIVNHSEQAIASLGAPGLALFETRVSIMTALPFFHTSGPISVSRACFPCDA